MIKSPTGPSLTVYTYVDSRGRNVKGHEYDIPLRPGTVRTTIGRQITMTEIASSDTKPLGKIAYFPVGFFSSIMGLYGTALAFHAAGFAGPSIWIAGFATLVFACILTLYAAKAVLHPSEVVADWNHPVKIAFFPAISISLLLGATAMRGAMPDIAAGVWIAGAVLQAMLTLAVIASWIGHRGFGAGHLSPAWFIPAVGNVVAPIAGVPLGYIEVSWYFFSVGLLFWLILLTIVINRLVFHEPMAAKLRPTLVILIAPPAVGFLAWTQLNGGVVDPLGRVLMHLGVFFTALVVTQIPALLRLPFALSFWALSFPFAAMTVACFRYAELTMSGAVFAPLAWVLLAVLSVIVIALLARTILAVVRSEICLPE